MNKKFARKVLEAKNIYKKTNEEPMKRLRVILIDYEKANGGHMKRH